MAWSTGRIIFDPGQNDQAIGNQILVPTAGPAKGVLVDGFNLLTTHDPNPKSPRASESFSVAVIRSTDQGPSFSKPVVISPMVFAAVSINGKALRTGDILPESAAGPEGNLYAV